jgi:hypothetical protein
MLATLLPLTRLALRSPILSFSDEKVANRNVKEGCSGGRSHVHVRRERLGFLPRSRGHRPVPNPSVNDPQSFALLCGVI